jgi:hypothetical protein
MSLYDDGCAFGRNLDNDLLDVAGIFVVAEVQPKVKLWKVESVMIMPSKMGKDAVTSSASSHRNLKHMLLSQLHLPLTRRFFRTHVSLFIILSSHYADGLDLCDDSRE